MKTTIGELGSHFPTSISAMIPMAIKLRDPTEECWIFQNGNYNVLFLKDGTKVRFNDLDTLIPDHPECIDMTISTYCENNCSFCYMSCSKNGKKVDSDSEDLDWVLDQLWPGTELAVNCNSLSPDDFQLFYNFLKKVHAKCPEVFVNVTINEFDFMIYVSGLSLLQRKGLIHGIGVSIVGTPANNFTPDIARKLGGFTKYYMERFTDCVNHTENVVLHVIPRLVSIETFDALVSKITNPKFLLLGYKNMGRGVRTELTKQEETNLQNWEGVVRQAHNNTLQTPAIFAMDGLALKELHVKDWVSEEYFNTMYAGNEGAYTFYLDLPNRKYARSSIEDEQFDWGNKSLMEMFKSIQSPALGEKGGRGC